MVVFWSSQSTSYNFYYGICYRCLSHSPTVITFKVCPNHLLLSKTRFPRLYRHRHLTSIVPRVPSADYSWWCVSSMAFEVLVFEVRLIDLQGYSWYLSWTLFPVVLSAHLLWAKTSDILTWNANGTQIHCVQYRIASMISMVFSTVTPRSKLRSFSGVLIAFLDLIGEWGHCSPQ